MVVIVIFAALLNSLGMGLCRSKGVGVSVNGEGE